MKSINQRFWEDAEALFYEENPNEENWNDLSPEEQYEYFLEVSGEY